MPSGYGFVHLRYAQRMDHRYLAQGDHSLELVLDSSPLKEDVRKGLLLEGVSNNKLISGEFSRVVFRKGERAGLGSSSPLLVDIYL